MKLNIYWYIPFIVCGLLAVTLQIISHRLLRKKGYKISWIGNLNAWRQLFDLIRNENDFKSKIIHGLLLFGLVLFTIGTLISVINV